MKTIVLTASARKQGNTAKIAQYLEQDCQMSCKDLTTLNVGYFDYEHKNKEDDFLPFLREIIEQYDQFLFVSPLYWYSVSAQLKVFLDRFSDLLLIEKELGRKLRTKHMALIFCAYAEQELPHLALPIERTANYLGMKWNGHLYLPMPTNELTAQHQNQLQEFIQTIHQTYE